MAQTNTQPAHHLAFFIQKVQKTCSQLLKEIRKCGDDNISTRYYLQEFKNFQNQLNTKEPLKQIFNSPLLQTLEESLKAMNPEQEKAKSSSKGFPIEESLKPAVRRQLVLIQSQQSKCQQICKMIENIEPTIKEIQTPDDSLQLNPQEIRCKLLPIYSVAGDWLKDLLIIVQDMISLLQNHLQSFQSSTISFQKSTISSGSNQRSALTSILQNMNRPQKLKTKEDFLNKQSPIKKTMTHKRLVSKFQICDKPLFRQIRPAPIDKKCVGCLLF